MSGNFLFNQGSVTSSRSLQAGAASLQHQHKSLGVSLGLESLVWCAGGLGQWPSMSGNSFNSQGSDVASIHSKLDQLIAAYSAASTPRGITPPESIFSSAPYRQAAAAMEAQLATAESIAPNGRVSSAGSRADDRDFAGSAHGRAVAEPALNCALADAAVSATHSTPAKVRFAFSEPTADVGTEATRDTSPAQSNADDVTSGGTAAAAAADAASGQSKQGHPKLSLAVDAHNDADARAPQTADLATAASSNAKLRGWNRFKASHSASLPSSLSITGPGAAAAPTAVAPSAASESAVPASALAGDTEAAEAGRQAVPLPAGTVKSRGAIKKLLHRAFH